MSQAATALPELLVEVPVALFLHLFIYTFLLQGLSKSQGLLVNLTLGKGANQGGDLSDDRDSFCSLVLPGFHPDDHLAAYQLLGHLQEHPGFK